MKLTLMDKKLGFQEQRRRTSDRKFNHRFLPYLDAYFEMVIAEHQMMLKKESKKENFIYGRNMVSSFSDAEQVILTDENNFYQNPFSLIEEAKSHCPAKVPKEAYYDFRYTQKEISAKKKELLPVYKKLYKIASEQRDQFCDCRDITEELKKIDKGVRQIDESLHNSMKQFKDSYNMAMEDYENHFDTEEKRQTYFSGDTCHINTILTIGYLYMKMGGVPCYADMKFLNVYFEKQGITFPSRKEINTTTSSYGENLRSFWQKKEKNFLYKYNKQMQKLEDRVIRSYDRMFGKFPGSKDANIAFAKFICAYRHLLYESAMRNLESIYFFWLNDYKQNNPVLLEETDAITYNYPIINEFLSSCPKVYSSRLYSHSRKNRKVNYEIAIDICMETIRSALWSHGMEQVTGFYFSEYMDQYFKFKKDIEYDKLKISNMEFISKDFWENHKH